MPFSFLKGRAEVSLKKCEINRDFQKILGYLGIFRKFLGYLQIFGGIFRKHLEISGYIFRAFFWILVSRLASWLRCSHISVVIRVYKALEGGSQKNFYRLTFREQ